MAIGLLPPWVTTLGFLLPPCGRNLTPPGNKADRWQPLTSCLTAVGVWRQMYISKNFWFDHLFSKIKAKQI
jgi:hypothetical protein